MGVVTIVALQNRSIPHYTKNFMQIDRFVKTVHLMFSHVIDSEASDSLRVT